MVLTLPLISLVTLGRLVIHLSGHVILILNRRLLPVKEHILALELCSQPVSSILIYSRGKKFSRF